MYDPALSAIIHQAFQRLQSAAQAVGPLLGQRILTWMQTVTAPGGPEQAFKSPGSFPMLLLPWFAEQSLHRDPDPDFQSHLVYSTAGGYLFIRLMDNLMDGHGEEQHDLLPAFAFFHTCFQSPYQAYFSYQHPFWEFFNRTWMHSAEATLEDSELKQIDLDLFLKISAHKTCAAKIPLAAVFWRYEQPDAMENWLRFVELFGRWHQMWNDLFGWVKDLQYGTQTYFLSEARRSMRQDEALADWVIREGFERGLATLDEWMNAMQAQAAELGSPPLLDYLHERQLLVFKQKTAVLQTMHATAGLLAGMKQVLQAPKE